MLATLPWLLCVSAWDIPEKYSPYKSYFIRWYHPQSFKRAVLITCLYDRSKNIITKPTLRKRNIIWRQAKTVAWWLVAHVFLSFLVAPTPEIVVAWLMSLSMGSCRRRFRPAFCIKSSFFQQNRRISRISVSWLPARLGSSSNHECDVGNEEI